MVSWLIFRLPEGSGGGASAVSRSEEPFTACSHMFHVSLMKPALPRHELSILAVSVLCSINFCALNVFEGCFSVKLFGMDGLRAFSRALDQILEPITSSLTVPWEHKIGLNEQSDILCPKSALRNHLGQSAYSTDEETFAQSFSMGTRPASLCFPVRGGVCC